MSKLKDLVSKVREKTESESISNNGDKREVYHFDTKYFPNSSEYSNTNENVGRRLHAEDDDTVSFIGETLWKGGAEKLTEGILDGVDDAITDLFGVVSPVLRKFINDEEFIVDQAKLHSMNRLSGKIFNPVGILASYLDDEIDGAIGDTALSGLLTQTLSVLSGGGGLFKTTDGETYYGVLDNDAASDIFSLQALKDTLGGGDGTGIIGSILRQAGSTLAEGIGIQIPTKSIVGQVLAYNNTLFETINGGSRGWLGKKDSKSDDENINPIGINAINYLYDAKLIVKDPVRYYELSQKISRGLMANNVMVSKPDDLLVDEQKALSNKFGKWIQRGLGVDIPTPHEFWTNNTKSFRPDDGDIVEDIMEYMFFPISNEGEDYSSSPIPSLPALGSIITDINYFSYRHLRSIFDNLDDGIGKEIEDERLKKLATYSDTAGGDNPSNSEKIKSNKDNELAVEENDQPNKYKFHNIQTNLGKDFRKSLEDKTFSNLHKISNKYNQDDPINAHDIFDITEGDDSTKLETNHFMSIEDVGNKKVIYLRPTFDDISEDIQVNQGDFFYIGRTEPFPNYENTTRSITMNFKMYSDTPNEFLMMWKKMNFLNSLAYPTSAGETFRDIKNPLIRFTVGDIFKRLGGYLNTINYSYSNSDVTWETAEGLMAPKIIDVSMSFTVLHDSMPYVNANNKFEFGKSKTFSAYGVDYSKEVETESEI